mgnify:CR=1 FL=1|nr:MAG TPA: hypothetical protein [Caudoviricetes sp.]
MKFQKNDVVRRVLPSGTMVGGLMVVINGAGSKCTAVRDVSTGKCCIYKSSSLEKLETTKIMVGESDMNKIDIMKGVGSFYHEVSYVYDKLYANPTKFVCFILAKNGELYIEHFILEKYLEYYEKLTKPLKVIKSFQLKSQCINYN